MAFAALLACAPAVFGQSATGEPASAAVASSASTHSVPAGEKMKVKGVIVERDDNTFTVRDEQGRLTVCALTGETSVKTKGGFFHTHKEYTNANLLRGLKVEVEGRGDSSGQLEVRKVRFHEHDMDVARALEYRTAPLEARVATNEAGDRAQAGQIDELNERGRLMRADIDRNKQDIDANERAIAATDQRVTATNERINALDEWEVSKQETVLFKLNSAVLTPEATAALDQLSQQALGMKGYVIEVAGFTDSTGSEAKNRSLSHRRADAVVQYLAEVNKVPQHRIVVPFGYGETQPAADNATREGRVQNRRVEVRILLIKGLVNTN